MHPLYNWVDVLTGATVFGIIAHAVNSFPTPKNQYGQWFLGVIKFAVGQRISAMNAIRGNDTVAVPVPQGTGAAIQGIQSKAPDIQVTEDKIIIAAKAESKTVIPVVGGTGTGE